MATVKGAVKTIILDSSITGVPGTAGGASNWTTPGYIRGAVRVMVDYYVGLGTETAGTVIQMHPLLDVGAMILYHVLSISTGLGALTVSVGDLDSATRYASASTALQTTGAYLIRPALGTTGNYIIGTNPATPTDADNDRQIILTTAGATLTAGYIISLMTFYTID
jgi:hypothetical protein